MPTPSPQLPSVDADRTPEAATFPPRRASWIAMLLLTVVGLAVAGYLADLHVRVHLDPSYRSFCAVNEAVNCETVAQSPYSVFLGLPIAVWGLLGFLLMGALAVPGALGRRPMPGAMLAVTTVGMAWCLVLGTISVVAIESVCLLCLATYAINLALLLLALSEARRAGFRAGLVADARWFASRPAVSGGLAVAGIAALGALMAFYPAYWRVEGPGARQQGLPTGLEDGHPWIGARQPKLTIVEFSDYQCPHCQRGHQEARALVAKHPAEVRLIHRNFPLDQACNPMITRPFHSRACDYAVMAACAGQQGRFWEANDFLFASGRAAGGIDGATLAAATKLDVAKFEACLAQQAGGAVAADVAEGLRLGIKGTPSYVVDGKLYPGRVPDEIRARLTGPAAQP